jgi:hypothetical protein
MWLLAFLLLAGCAGTQSRSIPPNVNDVYLSPIENQSSETGLENILSDMVTQQLLADGRVDLVERENAQVVLIGTITNYQRIPLIYNDQDIVQQYKVRVEMDITLKDPKTGEILNQFDNIFRETTYSDINPPIETEFSAQERVLRKLARDVVSVMVEGWPYLELGRPHPDTVNTSGEEFGERIGTGPSPAPRVTAGG